MTDMRSRLRPGRRRVAAFGAAAYAAIFLAGCGNASSAGTTTQGAHSSAISTSARGATAANTQHLGDTTGTSASNTQPQVPSAAATTQPGVPAGSQMERTASVSLEVKREDFDVSLDKVFGVMRDLKGFVAQSDMSGDSAGLRNGTISFKVPSERFEDAIAKVRGLGTVKSLNVTATDVSSQYIDLQARLRNLEAQEQAMLTLYAQTKGVQEIISVDNQVATVRGQIEQVKGQLNFLDNQVSYSTVSVSVAQVGVGVAPGGDEWGFKTAVIQAAHAAVAAINVIVLVLGTLSPLLVLGGLAALVGWLVRQRVRPTPELA